MSNNDLQNVLPGRLYDYTIRMSTERKFKIINYHNYFKEDVCIEFGITAARIVHHLPNHSKFTTKAFLSDAFNDIMQCCDKKRNEVRNIKSFQLAHNLFAGSFDKEIRNVIKPLLFTMFDKMDEGIPGISTTRLDSTEKKAYFDQLVEAALEAQVIAAPADLLVTKEATKKEGNGFVSNKRRRTNDNDEPTTTTTTAETKKGGIVNWLKSRFI